MSYDELNTVLLEVEAVLNSWPISFLSSEDMEEPLTPSLCCQDDAFAHYLTGGSLWTIQSARKPTLH